MTMTWQNGHQLATLQKGDNSVSYKYDSDGVRVSKTVNGEKYTYEYLNGLLLYETRGEKFFHYFYDPNGTLYGVNYKLTPDGTTYAYYFTHNWRGDIIGIYNGTGNLVAEYEYDSWGNVTAIKNANGDPITNQNHISHLNPFRYRGYYMDTETGMYYLMSRYYDPVTHRFLNADGYFQTGLGVLDANMNIYCGNNPVNYFDPFGTISSKAIQRDIVNNPNTTKYTLADAILAAKAEAGYSATFAEYSYEFSIGPFEISSYSSTSYSLYEPDYSSYVDFDLSEFSASMHHKFSNYDLSYNIDQKSVYGLLGIEYNNCINSVGFGRQYKDKASSLHWDITAERENGWSYSNGYIISISDENRMNIAKGAAVVLGVVAIAGVGLAGCAVAGAAGVLVGA